MAEQSGGSRWRAIGIVGVAVLCLWASSCSSGSNESSGPQPLPTVASSPEYATLSDAFNKTIAIDSATVRFTLSGGGRLGQTSLTSEGSLDFVTGSASSTTSGGGEAQLLMVEGDRTWLRFDSPQFDAFLPNGAKWIEAPTSELVERGVISMNREVSWAPLYPLVGAENIDVDETGRIFTFDVDVPAVRPALTAEQRKAFNALLGSIADPDILTSTSGTVTLDGDGRVIDYHVEFWLEDPASGEEVSFAVDLALSDIGEPVIVTPPPANEVANVADHPGLLDQLSGPGPGY